MTTTYHNTVAPPRNGKSPNPFSSKAFKPSKKNFSSSAVSESLNKREVIDRLQQQASSGSDGPRVAIVLVPKDQAHVEGERWWIEVRQFDVTWHYPIQWRRDEIPGVYRLVKQIDWTLDTDDGYPVKIRDIHAIFKAWVDEGRVRTDLLEVGEVA